MFRHRQQLRQWAARVLLLWLFGIGAGFANACITTAPAAAAASHIVAVVDAHHDVVSHDHAQAASAGLPSQSTEAPAHLGNLSKANCQDFCDKSAISIPSLKSALDLAQADALLPPVAAILYAVAACEPVQWWSPRRGGVLGLPITITLLRLAL